MGSVAEPFLSLRMPLAFLSTIKCIFRLSLLKIEGVTPKWMRAGSQRDYLRRPLGTSNRL
jgi:hypothetical protein